jgi:Apea-like HEPN
MFERFEKSDVKPKDIQAIKTRLYQVRSRFNLTFKKLLNNRFFEKTESLEEFTKLTAENIENCIKAAYDLRSKYVHTGIDFGHWLAPRRTFMNEILLGMPVVDDKELKKILSKVPTFIGLERAVRFALLRFLHINDVYIHAELDNNTGE